MIIITTAILRFVKIQERTCCFVHKVKNCVSLRVFLHVVHAHSPHFITLPMKGANKNIFCLSKYYTAKKIEYGFTYN